MRSTVVLAVGTCVVSLLVASVLSYGHPANGGYSQKSVAELIDDLTQIDSETVAINSNSVLAGFIAYETPVSLRGNPVGIVVPDAPPQMRELVQRGPLALPELIKHLDDKRPTKLDVGNTPPGNSGVFMGKVFGYEYDPRVRDPHPTPLSVFSFFQWTRKGFASTYTLRVGDVCYALIGQIVNRRLFAVRSQPTGFLVVNSPIEAPILIENVKSDWGNGDAESVRASLLADIQGADRLTRISHDLYIETSANPALRRLKLYFPDDYKSLAGNDLQEKIEFEKKETAQRSFSTRQFSINRDDH
jgi:hypothetical protein